MKRNPSPYSPAARLTLHRFFRWRLSHHARRKGHVMPTR